MQVLHFWRTGRGFHLTPRIYPGINGCTTKLLVWLWWGVEFK